MCLNREEEKYKELVKRRRGRMCNCKTAGRDGERDRQDEAGGNGEKPGRLAEKNRGNLRKDKHAYAQKWEASRERQGKTINRKRD